MSPTAQWSRQIGAAVQAARRAAGLTQSDLCDRCGIEPRHISRLESGAHLPSLHTLRRIADALHLPLASFLETA